MLLIGVALMSIALVSGSPTITMDNSYPVTISRRSTKTSYDSGDLYNNGYYWIDTELDFDTSSSAGYIYHFTSLKYDFQITNEPGFYLHQYYEFKPVFDSGVVNLIGIKLDAYTDQYQGAQMVSNLYIPYFTMDIRTDSGLSDFTADFYGINNLTNTYQSNTYYFDGVNIPIPEGDDIYNIEFYFNVYSYDYATTERFSSLVSGDVFNSGYNSGYDSGYNSGYSEGYQYGVDVGFDEGLQYGSDPLIQQYYNEGYHDAIVDNQDYWYNEGYHDGELVGMEVANRDALIANQIFTGIISIALVPVNFFLGILNFDVFGINIGALVSSLLTVLVLITIIKTIFGSKSGGTE